jgi:hypothetical protein
MQGLLYSKDMEGIFFYLSKGITGKDRGNFLPVSELEKVLKMNSRKIVAYYTHSIFQIPSLPKCGHRFALAPTTFEL